MNKPSIITRIQEPIIRLLIDGKVAGEFSKDHSVWAYIPCKLLEYDCSYRSYYTVPHTQEMITIIYEKLMELNEKSNG